MRESLGLVETRGISTAIQVADVMVKAANVKILELENSRGSGYMTTKIVGDVGAVKAAVSAAKAEGMKYGNLVSASVIARPSDGMASLFCNPKVPYQSVNKKPVSYGVEDNKSANKTAKKDEPKKATSKKAEPEKKVEAPKSAPAQKQKAPVKTVDVKAETKKAEPAKVVAKKVEPTKKVEIKKEEPKKVEAKKPEPKKETPKVAPKPKQKTSSPKKKK